jgi:predicted homoserine dehydrogenase-like protein
MIDTLLGEREKSGRPIRIGLVGAGVMGRMVALQLLTPPPGMRLVCIANRTPAHAKRAFEEGGIDKAMPATSAGELDQMIESGRVAYTADPKIACDASGIDVIVEVTGTLSPGAETVTRAIAHKKHIVLVNAELDSTLGPILKTHAERAGVVITNIDGDEPGVAMNLVRYLKTLGLRPVAAGNLKGMIDPYRTPDTQKDFAQKYGQNPAIVTSFADGTKLSMEEAILANASGFGVGKRGMYGPKCAHVKEIASLLPAEQMLAGGLVDYALGAEPGTGAFVVVHEPNPRKQSHLAYLKMGNGPFYVFYTPYHLPHIQLASTIARAALTRDATTAPIGAPICDVIAIAKRDLRAGETLDGVGGFACYGVVENASVARVQQCLPMGISGGCVLTRDLMKDEPLTYGAVTLPEGRLIDRLRAEQDAMALAGA